MQWKKKEEDQEKFKKDEEQIMILKSYERTIAKTNGRTEKETTWQKEEKKNSIQTKKLENIGVEIKVTETSNPKKGKISRYDINSGTYEVTLDNGTNIKGISASK